jgi:hypothetical protein
MEGIDIVVAVVDRMKIAVSEMRGRFEVRRVGEKIVVKIVKCRREFNSSVGASGKKTPKVETFYPVLSRLNENLNCTVA